ncbi:DNA cytosine methyltransferase [Pseudomonas sp. NY15364]|uniref:DNA cytosine methyltransferase n=1 Tax=Pseudomonas sp. NY15364 TaxID=3400353 RepID=UPI003A8C4339
MITYGSVCSGIEAATVAWHPLGWRAEWFAEIEPFPSAVLAYRWPDVSNLGDMTKLARQVLAGSIAAPDVLVGGTPCQAFSVAGMRAGLDDPRGQLTIKYVELADAVDHVRTARGEPECIVVWENVPGVLTDKGNAFGCFLAALVGESIELVPPRGKWTKSGCVYGPRRTAAWRVLDAQYFGLAQRRKRVFVVASARAGFDPEAVLFEREGMRRDTPPRRGQGQDLTGQAPFRPALQCGCGCTFEEQLGNYGCPNCEGDEGPAVSVIAGVPAFGGHSLGGSVDQAATLTAKDTRMDVESETFFVAPTIAGGARKAGGYSLDDIPLTAGTLTREAFSGGAGGRPEGAAAGHFIVAATLDASYGRLQGCSGQDANHGHSHLVVHGTQDPDVLNDQAHPLGRNHGQENAVIVFDPTQITCPTCRSNPQPGDPCHTLTRGMQPPTLAGSQVRRLTPRECERLQGFPDDYTLIPWRGKPAQECPDGPRYKAIGNSKAVPVVRWIGRRIQRELERAQ